MKKASGLMFVISGPSGVGKGTIYNVVLERLPFIKRSISVTTRLPRAREAEGVNYYFKTIEEYQQMIANGDFLETASVFQNYYGTPKAPIMEMLENGDDVMFEIDVEGAKQIKAKYPQCIQIFILTPTLKMLEERLKKRGTETEASLRIRLSGARGEIGEAKQFDYLVFNDNLDDAVDSVISIIKAEKSKMTKHNNTIIDILGEK